MSNAIDGRRIHVCTRAKISVSGGLHGVALGLAEGQKELGLESRVFHAIKTLKGQSYELSARAESDVAFSWNHRSHDDILEFHFAQTAFEVRNEIGMSIPRAIFHFHGPWFREARYQRQGRLRVQVKRLLEQATYSKFPLFTAHSSAFADLLNSDFGISRKKIEVFHPGVDTVRFKPRGKSEIRVQLGLNEHDYYFLIVRRLEPRMGIDTALRALSKIPDAKLLIAGTGSMSKELEALCDDLKITERVTFLGRVSESVLPILYNAADTMLVPSVALEGFGLIVLEAFASGLEVISSDTAGLPEAMGPFRSTNTYESNNLGALTEMMKNAIISEKTTGLFRAYAEGMSWKNSATRLEEIFIQRGV